MTAFRVTTQARKRQVNVLLFDVCAEREVECALDELRRLGSSKCTESSVALETRLAIDGLVQHNLVLKATVSSAHTELRTRSYLILATVVQRDCVHAAPQIRVDGGLITGLELVHHIEGRFDNRLVLGETGSTEHHRLELLIQMTVILTEFPSELVRLGAAQLAMEGLEGVLDVLLLEHPCAAERANAGKNLRPDDKFRLALEAV
jgi:hypothetical protein